MTRDDIMAAVREVLAEQPAITDRILTRAEAREFVKVGSEGGFCGWCKRYGVRPCGDGRYSRAVLERALERESKHLR